MHLKGGYTNLMCMYSSSAIVLKARLQHGLINLQLQW